MAVAMDNRVASAAPHLPDGIVRLAIRPRIESEPEAGCAFETKIRYEKKA